MSERAEVESTAFYNMVILPSSEVSARAVELSRDLSGRFDVRFTLDSEKLLPHITLYYTEYPKSNLRSLQKVLPQTIGQGDVEVVLQGFRASSGFVSWEVAKTRGIQELHERVLMRLSPLRTQKEVVSDLTEMAERQEHNLREYGYTMAFEDYWPHITLTRLANFDQAEEAVRTLPQVRASFRLRDIALTSVGQDGTCTGIIKKYRYGKTG